MSESLYPRMVQDYYVACVAEIARERDALLASLRTRTAALRHRATVRRKLRRVFGPLPARTPLNPRVTGVLERPRHNIEKVLFESRPGYFVTANLYVPRGQGPFPAVLGSCGHSNDGKADTVYQQFARGLAEQGYVVLIYDPVSQGERLQYDMVSLRRRPSGCVREHLMAGNQLALAGEFFGTWRLWDGIRALDYLLSRPEVDRTRVGVTGNSGGGTLSSYLNAMDDRFTMAAPSCFITTYLHNLENELPADSEQIPPGMLAQGLDMSDFIIAQAPRPVILIGQEQDFFDARGLRKTFAQVRRFYGLLGAAESVQLHIGPGGHGFHPDGRRAMYRFFNRVAGVKGSGREPTRPVEKQEDLFATPAGQVAELDGNRFIHDFARDLAQELTAARGAVSGPELVRHVRAVLQLEDRPEKGATSGDGGLPASARTFRKRNTGGQVASGARIDAPYFRVLRKIARSRSAAYPKGWCFAVQTEPGIEAMLSSWWPAAKQPPAVGQPPALREAVLYLPHLSSQQDVSDDQLPVEADPLLTLDVRGIGMSVQRTCGDQDFFYPYGQDYFYAAHGIMLDQSYLGRRVHDVLATLDLLQHRGTRKVHLVGRGLGAVLATYAACLHPLVKQVTLKHALPSYTQLMHTPVYGWPLSMLPWAGLRQFDLPDCYRMLERKQLRMIEPWDARMKPTVKRQRKAAVVSRPRASRVAASS